MKFSGKILAIFFLNIFFSSLFAVPMNNFYDSSIFYNVRGVDKYYIRRRPWFCLNISPYFQTVSGVRGIYGSRVDDGGENLGEGDRLGLWNILGVFFGKNASPADKKFEITTPQDYDGTEDLFKNYRDLALAYIVLDGDENTKVKNPTLPAEPNFTAEEIADSAVKIGTGANELLHNFTDEANFKPDDKLARISVPIDFEKVGLRSQFSFSFGQWFGANIKTGICHYTQRPGFDDKTTEQQDYTDPPLENSKTLIQRYLTDEKKLKKISNNLGLDIDRYSKTSMEDTHIEFYANYPIGLEDNSGELLLTFVPMFSFGVWAPSGSTVKQDRAFSLSTGNDGFIGLTVDGSLNFDFPGTIQIGIGAGASFFEEKNLSDQRIPSSKYQYGIYPWKADISKRPGVTWYANFSMMGQNFIEDFSFYIDVIYTEHKKDSINLLEENDDFYPQKMIDESSWKNEAIFMGLNYQFAPSCSAGISFQSVVGGRRVYRTTTVLGTMTLNF